MEKGNLQGNWSGSTLKFGNERGSTDVNQIYLIPAAIFLGVTGGLLGPLFIKVNFAINERIRKRYLTKKWMKPVETFFMCFLTASVFFWFAMFSNKCNTYKLE